MYVADTAVLIQILFKYKEQCIPCECQCEAWANPVWLLQDVLKASELTAAHFSDGSNEKGANIRVHEKQF